MWKHVKIIHLPKPDGKYRPIVLLRSLSKIFEHLVHEQIDRHLFDNSLLTNRQSGLRPKHSCVTALEELKPKIDHNMMSFLILLDNSKALDSDMPLFVRNC